MLTTERLTMRPFTSGDTEDFLGLAGHWDVARMTSDIPHPLTLADARLWLQPAPDAARFALVENGALIGGAGYFLQSSGAVEVGFWLGRAYWGRGLATEAVTAVIGYGLRHGHTAAFTSSHFTDNPASGRVLAKLGFEPTGTARIHSTARGVEVAAICYWLSREAAQARLGITVEAVAVSPPALSTLEGETPALSTPPPPAVPAEREGRLAALFGKLRRSA